MKNILLTGTAGFIGSNFASYFLNKYPEYRLVNVDLLTYAGSLDNLHDCIDDSRFIFLKGDINDRDFIENIFQKYNIQGIIHFAAESHVDNSIKNPDIFIKTNVNGTFTLLDIAYKSWMEEPFVYKKDFLNCRFHHISTDEVYGSLTNEGVFKESSPYAPNSPYAASKASSDMLVRSYNKTYGLNTVITNCSNNYGPKQHSEKLIPTVVRNALKNKPIPIYGDGKNVRDWLHVLDHCKAIDIVYHKGVSGEVYNVGADNEKENIELVTMICTILDEHLPKNKSYKELITFVEDRAGHDKRYAIDASKIKNDLGWVPTKKFLDGLKETVLWYLK